MTITKLFSFLISPGKGKDYQPPINAGEVFLEGKLHSMLSEVFEKADSECNIDIAFTPDENGAQKNTCRDLLLAFVGNPSLETSFPLASRLQLVTDERPGIGLLFLAFDEAKNGIKLVLSRFPADQGILAEADEEGLHVEFIEKVFMRNAFAYKAALYQGRSSKAGFWSGKAIDKQRPQGGISISDYWIRGFLQSDFKTTAYAGTKRMANLMAETMRSCDDLEIKQEISAAAILAKGLDGKPTSIREITDQFAFSEKTIHALCKKVPRESLLDDRFQFVVEEFQKYLPYRSLELSNGAILTANTDNFEQTFERSTLSDDQDEFEFRTRGRIVNDVFRKTK